MPSLTNGIFGVHEQALVARARRAELLASNLANADTPGYKARDVSFENLLAATRSETGGAPGGDQLAATHGRHLADDSQLMPGVAVQYRNPTQPSLDGNTVDTQVEQTAFLENALAYQTTLTFLEQRIAGIRLAIRGE